MGRPERRDVDYFPFYAKDGRTLGILESKYQCKGTGFFTNVLRFLSRQPDHHFDINDESDRMYFFSKMKCDDEAAEDMLNIMVKTGKLDKPLFDAGVIASQDHLHSIEDAYRQRNKDIITIEEIRALFGITIDGNGITIDGNAAGDGSGVVTSGINPHSIVEDTKEEKKSTSNPDLKEPKDFYLTKKKRKLNGKRFETFNLFWSAFSYKSGKAEAADAWLDIPELTDTLVSKIVSAARKEAARRSGLVENGSTPKMALGWITARRWEDEGDSSPNSKTPIKTSEQLRNENESN